VSCSANPLRDTLGAKLGNSTDSDIKTKTKRMFLDVGVIGKHLEELEEKGKYKDSGEFIEAVNYFNKELAYKDKITAEDIVALYERFRGDLRNPQYTDDIRNARIATIDNNDFYTVQKIETNTMKADRLAAEQEDYEFKISFEKRINVENVLTFVNIKFDSEEALLDAITRLFYYISIRNIFFERPGFDVLMPSVMSTVNQYQEFTYDGHHRIAWFLVNFMLINNGYLPYNKELKNYAVMPGPRHKLYEDFKYLKDELSGGLEKAPTIIADVGSVSGTIRIQEDVRDENMSIVSSHLVAA
jgi:hypothetical protein